MTLFEENIDINRIKDIFKIIRIDINKLNNQVNMNTKTLSEGQKQKITIARSLHFNSNFLILDETLSHLDKISHKNIMLHLLKKEKLTLINCAHNVQNL